MRPCWLRRPLPWLALGLVGFLWLRNFLAVCGSKSTPPPALPYGAPIQIEARAMGPPHDRPGGLGLEAKIESSGERAFLLFPDASLDELPKPGEIFGARVILNSPQGPRNPGDFNEKEFLSQRGILYAGSVEELLWIRPASGFGRMASFAESVRRSLEKSWRESLPAIQADLASGLSLGFKGRLPSALRRHMTDAGVMHLVVPSGAKVAWILLGVALLGRFLALSPWQRLSASAVFGGFYTLMVGADPPYFRALIAGLFYQLGLCLGRSACPFQGLAWAALIECFLRPEAVLSLGFQMSYAAVLALVCGLPPHSKIEKNPSFSWVRTSLLAIAATILVEAALYPLLASAFGRVALLGALANAVLVPASGILVALSLSLAAVHGIGPAWMGAALAFALRGSLSAFEFICACFASLPGAAMSARPLFAFELWSYYGALAALLFLRQKKISCALAFLSAGLWIGGQILAQKRTPELRVVYLSLSRGKAAFVFRKDHAPMAVVDHARTGPFLKAATALGAGRLERTIELGDAPGFLSCAGSVCFSFKNPCIQARGKQLCIMPLLQKSSVEVSTDGLQAWLRSDDDPIRHPIL